MTALALTLAAALAVVIAVALAPDTCRLIQSLLAERKRRRQRLAVTLTELHLQHLARVALAQLLDEARQSLGDLDRRR